MTAGGSAAFVGTPAEVALIRFGLLSIEFSSLTHKDCTKEYSLPVLKCTTFSVRMTSDGSLPVDKRRNYSSVFNAIARIYKVTCSVEIQVDFTILFPGRGTHDPLEGGHTYYG